MSDDPILICYDGSHGADLAIDAAAALLGPRRAVVLDVGPPLTPEESLAVLAPVAPAGAFRELNADDALDRARTAVGLLAPGLLLARALALGAGFAWGLTRGGGPLLASLARRAARWDHRGR